MSVRRPVLRRLAVSHIGPALAFVALAVGWSYPLVTHLACSLPGPGPGDNVAFLWNAWWARAALQHSGSYWNTWAVFAPSGASLVLHTHTALPALAAATVLGRLPLVVAHNLTLLVGLYAQAYHLAGRRKKTLGETVRAFREYLPEFFPLPHPSWRNRRWVRDNPWFAKEVLPALRRRMRTV